MRWNVVILVALMFIGALVPVNATLTDQDTAWSTAIYPNIKMLIDDCAVLSASADSKDMSMLQMACNTMKEDIISAEAVNLAMPVSSDMQPAKDDYTSALTSIWAGLDDINTGMASYDITKVKLGMSKFSQGTVYLAKMNRDIHIAQTS